MEKALFLLKPPQIPKHFTYEPCIPRSRIHVPRTPLRLKIPSTVSKCSILFCSQLSAWEPSSLPYVPPAKDDVDNIVKGSNIFESFDIQDANTISAPEDESVVANQTTLQPLKWPMWLSGPLVLLLTGIVPTLWLPLSSVFLGCNVSSLLSLVGLDCIFNIGATLFLLMADTCARSDSNSGLHPSNLQIPQNYRFWNIGASLVGFIIPLIILLLSHKSILQPHLPFLSFAVLFGPYLLLLFMQMLTEMLTWHWRSPVWLIVPIVYEAYRVLQLMRGLRLVGDIGGPAWVVDGIRGLVSWWILIVGVQLMRISWFVGFRTRFDPNRNEA